jgi:glycosyltransferase involved in cell wall biosynthesis
MNGVVRVSVIVPLYNKARYVQRCLDSILQQTFADFEVIVIDDGSTDEGPRIVETYPDPRIRLLRQENGGPGAARNRACGEALGDLIAPLDADDAWDPVYLAESVRLMDHFGQEVVLLTWAMMELPSGFSTAVRWKKIGIPDGRFLAVHDSQAELVAAMLSNMLPSSTVIRRPIFEEMGGFYEKDRCLFGEDAYLWLKILLRFEVAFAARPLSLHYLDASELSMNVKGVRPVEPFLTDTAELYRTCPDCQRELLRRILALRACKTASVYGYFGQNQRARDLMKSFVTASDWRLSWFFPALLGCTPAAKWLGALARLARVNLRATHA